MVLKNKPFDPGQENILSQPTRNHLKKSLKLYAIKWAKKGRATQ